jgi:hypothetical protein
MNFYLANGMQQLGPLNVEQVREYRVRPETLVWRDDLPEWVRADSLIDFRDLCDATLDAPVRHFGYAPDTSAVPLQAPAVVTQQYMPHQPPAYAPQQPAYQGQLNYQTPSASESQGMAVASLVMGITSIPATCFYAFGIPLAILAVIFGFIARGRAKRGEGGGEGMALAGLICGFISLGIVAIFVVFIIFAMIIAALA